MYMWLDSLIKQLLAVLANENFCVIYLKILRFSAAVIKLYIFESYVLFNIYFSKIETILLPFIDFLNALYT